MHFNNQYECLGKTFYVKTNPVPVANPTLIKFNDELAKTLGLSSIDLNSTDGAAIFSGNYIPDGADPLAMAYAGHQFGGFNPQLGDGRAILLGDIETPDNKFYAMQLKGSGRTAFSRSGDGRAALGPVIREYLLSEAMFKLGVPTTRALAVVTTGEDVVRGGLVPGGIITRIATSFVRVGTFQYFSAQGDADAVKKLADFVIERNYPQACEAENPYIVFFQSVVDAQVALIAQWMTLGFIHGVMNTDNMSIAGETIDYGPCAFMDAFDHDQVFSSIDRRGRYAYSNQPSIGLWDLTRLAETLLPLLADDTDAATDIAKEVLQSYVESSHKHWLTGMRAKCGLSADPKLVSATAMENDKTLIEELFDTMADNAVDFTLMFFHLSRLSNNKQTQASEHENACRDLFAKPEQFDEWLVKWRKRLDEQTLSDDNRQAAMQAVNPIYIPRNHQIEAAIRAAEDRNDFSVFHELHDVLQNPYVIQEGKDKFMLPPKPDEVVVETFCGT
ncbi:MAG: YdiU family protein [Gammaproteobacteria bacterium]|nr:YdiU family protein [Gammaproteobacteria bacterium]